MKKILFVIIFTVICSIQNYSQINVKIEVISHNVKSDEKVFIAGNIPMLGNWNPGLVNLEKINDSTWSKTFSFEPNQKLEFKFTKGSWGNEALNQNKAVPENYLFTTNSDTTLCFNINYWKDEFLNSIKHKVTGKVEYYYNFKGENILPRDIVVWFPPSYDSLHEKHYPVLYMQDGQNIFDPATSSFGNDWQLDETADSLIRHKAINEIIIVGIYNTYQRNMEYSETDSGYAYMKFIVNKLKPFIDVTYRTLPDKENTAVGGSSLGGLISFMLAWQYPNVFSKAACLSPAFKIGKIDFVSNVLSYKGPRKNIKFYIDNGGLDLEEKLQPGVDEMLSALEKQGYQRGRDIYYYKDYKATHNELAWAGRAYRFLEYFFGKKG